MRKTLVAVLVAALAGVLAASAMAATRTVKVGDNYFVRNHTKPTITVSKGTKIRFKWVGKTTHNVRVNKGPARFHSTYRTSGTFSRTLDKRGTYRLLCDVHPSEMRLTIKVR